jgi:hypothetical protein
VAARNLAGGTIEIMKKRMKKKNQKKGGKDNFPKLINLANEILIS